MDFWEIAKDAVKSVGEANVIPIAIAAPFLEGKSPGEAAESIGKTMAGVLVPAMGLGEAAFKAVFGSEPNLEGAGAVPIIAAGLATLKNMQDQCGKGTPVNGSGFARGANVFHTIEDMVGNVTSPGSWTGTASEAYAFVNDLQRVRAGEMAELDQRIGDTLKTEAEQVVDTREVISGCVALLNGCIPQAIALSAAPVFGDELSLAFQVQSVGAIVPVAYTFFERLTGQAAQNAAQVKSAGSSYHPIRGEFDGQPPHVSGAALGVVTDDLRHLSRGQERVAAAIGGAGRTTDGEPSAVETSHGTVCAGTAAAVEEAQAARVTTADWMQEKSEQMAGNLERAAAWYDRADEQERGKLHRQMPPR